MTATDNGVVVVGFGVTGRAVARALTRRGETVRVFDDTCSAEQTGAARAIGVPIEETPSASELAQRLTGTAMIVPSPGVPPFHPIYEAAARAGIPVRSEIELGYQLLAERGRPRLVAITGTNGKTTVTTLVTAALQASGVAAVSAGNIGVPLIEAAGSDAEVCVAEVSSFQLEYTEQFRPQVSCWLNLSEDHLDWHPTLEHYSAAKSRIWTNQRVGNTAVVNADDSQVLAAASSIPAGVTIARYSVLDPSAGYRLEEGTLVGPGGTRIIEVSRLRRSLPHDVSNALAAAAVALSAGATVEGCRGALTGAPLLPHRVSLVGSAGGIDWYDDSKATTPASVMAAVAGFESVVLVAGGRNKGLDLAVLASAVPPVKAVVAIGDSAEEVADAFRGKVPVTVAANMADAVVAAASYAAPGDSVLLSPGCASFDWYGSYAERGDDYSKLVRSRVLEGGAGC
ncbi:MAG TPA: UDP-N-acetylmuramoyl-L-alanine--D-glutamate ligase [Acidimicrobiales bacterium]|nr:UDP-N-acetylmuramoyl-L-alanine--D-glutamate ligase [Acidimicrobiales bacterium]